MDTTTAKRAYRFRFYPTPEQEQTLRRTLGCCRKVYNMALEARSEAWTVRHESVSYEDTSRMLTDWKKTKEYAYLREVSSVPLQQSLRHLQAAYRNFFAKTGDYPRFKSKKNGGAATYAASAFTWDWDKRELTLAKIVFCQIEVVQNGVSIQSEKAAGFSPVERKDPPPLLFGFYPIRAWVRLYDSPSNLIILP